MSPSTCILWQNERQSVVLLDLPRSLEEAQVPSAKLATAAPLRRIVSAPPRDSPFPTPEPKLGSACLPSSGFSAQVSELMTRGFVDAALGEITASSYAGPWCLPRVVPRCKHVGDDAQPKKKSEAAASVESPDQAAIIPEDSRYFLGTIQDRRKDVLHLDPFDLIVMDPPWPNHSARRKRTGYQTADNFEAVEELLLSIPVTSQLRPNGLVAVWVTNAPRVQQLLTRPGGIFSSWGVELIDEWIWLKVTSQGEPLVSLDSHWRRPWERLLIASPSGGQRRRTNGRNRVIISVPDIHSRKPSLRMLFEPLLPPKYTALEVFARHLTAGWCAWGDSVLQFQNRHESWEMTDEEETLSRDADQGVESTL